MIKHLAAGSLLVGCSPVAPHTVGLDDLTLDQLPPPPPLRYCQPGVAVLMAGAAWPDLQTATAASLPGDVLWVCPGTWSQHASLTPPHQGPLTWAGITGNPGDSIIDGHTLPHGAEWLVLPDARFQALTFSRFGEAGSVYVLSGGVGVLALQDVDFRGNGSLTTDTQLVHVSLSRVDTSVFPWTVVPGRAEFRRVTVEDNLNVEALSLSGEGGDATFEHYNCANNIHSWGCISVHGMCGGDPVNLRVRASHLSNNGGSGNLIRLTGSVAADIDGLRLEGNKLDSGTLSAISLLRTECYHPLEPQPRLTLDVRNASISANESPSRYAVLETRGCTPAPAQLSHVRFRDSEILRNVSTWAFSGSALHRSRNQRLILDNVDLGSGPDDNRPVDVLGAPPLGLIPYYDDTRRDRNCDPLNP